MPLWEKNKKCAGGNDTWLSKSTMLYGLAINLGFIRLGLRAKNIPLNSKMQNISPTALREKRNKLTRRGGRSTGV
jgi:hypothetical protein